jgi:CubicO group peptidase (beta-lactamase class C family)
MDQLAGRHMTRKMLMWGLRLLLMLVLAMLVSGWLKRDELRRLMAVNTLFEPDRIVANFSAMNEAFLNVSLPVAAGSAAPLPEGPALRPPEGLDAWMAARRTTSIVVLKDGKLAYERYLLGTEAADLRIGWSLSKSIISALAGIVLEDGAIRSLDDPVTDYAPQLTGTAYDGVTLRQVLNMATGVSFDEDYMDYHSDINRMGRILALGGLMDDFAASLQDRFTPPGTEYQYVSIDTHVLAMVLRGATGQSIAALMGARLFGPLGVEQVPYYLKDGAGVSFALGGINMTTRDFARFGLLMAQRGKWQGQQIVPEDWVVASTTPSAPTDADEYGYGYHWWVPRDPRPREYLGRGIYGQYLYIDEETGVVIALTAADPEFRDPLIRDQNITWFRKIADRLEEG